MAQLNYRKGSEDLKSIFKITKNEITSEHGLLDKLDNADAYLELHFNTATGEDGVYARQSIESLRERIKRLKAELTFLGTECDRFADPIPKTDKE